MQCTDPVWLSAIGTIFLAIVALFGDPFWRWIRQPRLSASIKTTPPDCHMTFVLLGTRENLLCHYLRLRISNHGYNRAESVEVMASWIERLGEGGTYAKYQPFVPQNLKWSYMDTTRMDAISKGMPKHCDFGHILENAALRYISPPLSRCEIQSGNSFLALDVVPQLNSMPHILEQGTYRIGITVGAANAKPEEYTLEVVFAGEWFDTEEEMFTKGITVKML